MSREKEDRDKDLLARADTEPGRVAVDDAMDVLKTYDAGDDGMIRAVATVIAANPDETDRAIEGLQDALSDDDPAVRSAAATVIGSIAAENPSLLTPVTTELVDCLNDEAILPRINATHALSELALEAPEAAANGVPTLAIHLESEFPSLCELAARCLLEISRAVPTEIEPAVPALLTVVHEDSADSPIATSEASLSTSELDTHSTAVREHTAEATAQRLRVRATAAQTVATVANGASGTVPLDDRLLDVLDENTPTPIRRWTVAAVAALARSEPDQSESAITPLVGVLKSDAPASVRGTAAEALAHLAEEQFTMTTDATRSAIPALGDLLRTGDATARGGSAVLLTYLAERFPEEVAPIEPALLAALDAETDHVRARAAFVLGFIGGAEACTKLVELQNEDSSEQVRGAAAAALDEQDINRDE